MKTLNTLHRRVSNISKAPSLARQRLGLRQSSGAIERSLAAAKAPKDWRSPKPCGVSSHYCGRFLALLLALASAFFLSGCSAKSPDAQKARSTVAVPVIVAQARAEDVPVELRNIGNVEAYATVTIRSQITGQITKIHFREGQEVKAGDMLFTIDPRPSEGALHQSQADLKRDEANLVSARLEFDREKKLLGNSIASRDS